MSASVHAGRHTSPSPGSRHPPQIRHPQSRYPQSRCPPEQTPPGADTPPPPEQTEHAGRYGQRAGGTHPTGMQSCYWNAINRNSILQIIITHESTYSSAAVCLRHSCTLVMAVSGKRNSTFSMTVKNNHFVGVEVKIKSSTRFQCWGSCSL